MRFGGHDLLAMPPRERRRLCGSQIGMILQDPKYSLNPVMTVARQMGEAFRLREPGLRGRALRERIVDALAAVQIRDPARVADAYPHELSGGMGQRVMIAMMVSTGPRLLIAGDIEQSAQQALLRAEPTLRADVLKVPHHGSRTQEPDFLAGLGAHTALIGVGADNRHGHPAPETIELLERAGMTVMRTDTDGAVAIVRLPDGSLGVATRGAGVFAR